MSKNKQGKNHDAPRHTEDGPNPDSPEHLEDKQAAESQRAGQDQNKVNDSTTGQAARAQGEDHERSSKQEPTWGEQQNQRSSKAIAKVDFERMAGGNVRVLVYNEDNHELGQVIVAEEFWVNAVARVSAAGERNEASALDFHRADVEVQVTRKE